MIKVLSQDIVPANMALPSSIVEWLLPWHERKILLAGSLVGGRPSSWWRSLRPLGSDLEKRDYSDPS
jgi:hypothetical protein